MQLHIDHSHMCNEEYLVQPCTPTLATISLGSLDLYVQGRGDAERLKRALDKAIEGMDILAVAAGADDEPAKSPVTTR